MGLFKRIKNIIRSNINAKFSDTGFENDTPKFEPENFNHYTEEKPSNAPSKNINEKEQEYYANLELPYGAGFDEIKASYKRLLKKYHPDKFYHDKRKLEISQEVVKKLNLAYNYFEEKYTK